MISKAEIERVRELAKRATPGKWLFLTPNSRPTRELLDEFANMICAVAPQHQVRSDNRGGSFPSADGKYIAEMHPQRTLAWADEIERLQQIIEALRKDR